jgi:hypothetical protein
MKGETVMARSAKAMLAGAVLLVLGTGTAHAQLDDATIADIIRECRQLPDEAARIACYDNIPLGQPAAAPAASPASPQAPAARAPTGFGGEQLPRPAAAAPAEPREMTARLSAVAERRPGVYLLTLEDGAQWEFIDSVPPSYDPPQRGKTVELIGAALGSYLLRYDGQRGVRIRRVR